MQTGIAINPDVPVGGFPSYRKNRRIKVIQWERKIFKLYKKIGEDEFLLIHPETSAENILVDIEGIEAKDAAGQDKLSTNLAIGRSEERRVGKEWRV